MNLKKDLFDLTPEQEKLSKMMYGKIIKCLVAPYHTAQNLKIDYAPNIMMFPEKEMTHLQTKHFISMCANSKFDEVLIITTSIDIICDMVDDCVRILTEYDTIVSCPEKTFAANQHTVIYSILNNEKHQKSKQEKIKSHNEINKVLDLLHSDKKLSKEEIVWCQQIIDMIGEDIISRMMKNELDRKIGR
jgi:hypothetical protein